MKLLRNLVIATAFLFVLAPTDAEAVGVRLGAQVKVGAAGASVADFNSDLGFGYGANVYGAFAIIPKLYFGLYGDYQGSLHGISGSSDFFYVDLAGVGGVFRTSWFGFTGQLYGGYALGETLTENIDFDEETYVYGPQFGLFLAKEIVLVPAVTSLDIGGYFWWQNLHTEEIDGIELDPITYYSFGLGIQLNFGLGF